MTSSPGVLYSASSSHSPEAYNSSTRASGFRNYGGRARDPPAATIRVAAAAIAAAAIINAFASSVFPRRLPGHPAPPPPPPPAP